jgi:hypothetical protein
MIPNMIPLILCYVSPGDYRVTWTNKKEEKITLDTLKKILAANRNRLLLADTESYYFSFGETARYEGTWNATQGGRYFRIDQHGHKHEIDLETYSVATDSRYPIRNGKIAVVSPLAKR